MKHKIFFIVTGIIGFSVFTWLFFGFFGIQALFTEKRVHEAVPLVITENPPNKDENTEKNLQDMGPRVIAQGSFEQGDSTYTIQGKAVITEQNGVRTLSFTDFDVTNGPDLFVYVVSSPSPDNNAVKEAVRAGSFINIGELKGNIGNQTYILPPDLTLDKNSVISIWCRRFSRNFGTANFQL